MTPRTKGYVFGILAACLRGIHAVVVRHLTGSIDGLSIAGIRIRIASACLFSILLFSKKKITWKIANIKLFLLVALVGMAANFIVFHI